MVANDSLPRALKLLIYVLKFVMVHPCIPLDF